MKRQKGKILAASVLAAGMAFAASATPLPQPEFVDAGASTNVAALFSAISSSPPTWLYKSDWNIASIVVRGADVGGEMGAVKVVIDGSVLKLR